MKVEQVLERLGGVADTKTLVRRTSRARVRVALRRGSIVRDARGRYALPGADEARRAAATLSGVLCLDSAAQRHGWKLKHQPSEPAVMVPRNRKVSVERRQGVRLVYGALDPAERATGVTGFVKTVMHCAARLPFDQALTVADSALRNGDVTREDLLDAAEHMSDRYLARCRRVAREADGLADNPFESVLRAIALDIKGLDVRAQQWVDEFSRADLVDRRLRLVVEAESFEFHGKRRLLRQDCERYNAFVISGWFVIRFAWEQVMFDPAYVAYVLRAVVARLERRPVKRALCPACSGRAA